ncbi:MAG: NUDIX domain-containing protein [Candidatus Pacearchaeota archaeon]
MREEFKLIRLRQAVSAVVFKENKFLMVSGKNWSEKDWCFPQGGINPKETHFQAVERELKEELGTDNFKILTKSSIEHMYIFPLKIQEKKGCEGQFQTIWFVEFKGDFGEIKPNKEELLQYSWFNKQEIIPNMNFPEQKQTFEKVLEELTKLQEDRIF